jgi:hypothetical protein
MLRCHVETAGALKCLCVDKGGVVSFEYVIVAASVVAAAGAAFGPGAGAGVAAALTGMLSAIGTAILAVVGA